MKLSKLFTSVLATGFIAGIALQATADAMTLSSSYLSNDKTDTVRLQLHAKQDNLRVYSETNVNDFTSADSKVSSRLIAQYGFLKYFNASAMGTYANSYKQHVYGVGFDYKGYGAIIGADDNANTVGLVYGRYRNDAYKVSTGGHIDLMDGLVRGRLDVMYDINTMRIGYEVQFNDRTSTNWIKAQITF